MSVKRIRMSENFTLKAVGLPDMQESGLFWQGMVIAAILGT
jgi:hypothetical protein